MQHIIAIKASAPFDAGAAQAALAAYAWNGPVTVTNLGVYRRLLPEVGGSLVHGESKPVKLTGPEQFVRLAGNLSRVIALNQDEGGVTFVFELPSLAPEPKKASSKKSAEN
jgi:hypothetical protein